MQDTILKLLERINELYLAHKKDMTEHWSDIEAKAINRDFAWSRWYEISICEMNDLMVRASGLHKAFTSSELKTLSDWLAALEEHLMDSEPDYSVFSPDPTEGEKAFSEIVIAMQYNQLAQEQRNKSISEMVAMIKDKSSRSQELILEAICIDPTTIRNPTIAKFIDLAVINGDEKFLSRISSALLKKSPRPREIEFNHLRMMMNFVAELQGKKHPSLTALVEVNDNLKLAEETSDTAEALRHHIKLRRKDRRS